MGASEAAVDRGLVEDEGILDVVAFVGKDADDEVLAGRPIVGTDQVGGLGIDHRLLAVVELVASRVGPQFRVGRGKTEGLLDHACAHRDTRRCIVFGERHMGRTDAEDQGGVDLEVSVFGGQVGLVDRDVEVLLLLRVDELYESSLDEVFEGDLVRGELGDLGVRDHGLTVLDDDQGPSGPAAVGVDDDVAVELREGDVHLRGDCPVAPHGPRLFYDLLWVFNESDEGPVKEYA